ncbi:ATP synthase F1 subunit gamma [Butyrivibrio sp. INlla16]|uniref:ATP synthase F1 subunit gamma n=1 Tax=Butyrivibrio sp. INlla16 TaxID=1520807 RepID=UPI00087EC08A|nr:ATP synthase F1 subunit gamma [Butyrivibrio sp. INlla16]SDB17056.1 F-type H+-transporting ATPase subunit gamma [Butyrivibrio sp. INlla16]
MANIKEIRDRIGSIRDTMKITNAMYMISSNKLRKAKKQLADTEPYFYALQAMIARVSRHIPDDVEDIFLKTTDDIPFEARAKGYLVLTSDKGLAGAFNHNVVKAAEEHIRNNNKLVNYKLYVVGEFGRHYFTSLGLKIEENFRYTAQNPNMDRSRDITSIILDDYANGTIDEVYVVYTSMKNSITSEVKLEKILPLDIIENARNRYRIIDAYNEEFIFDPSPKAIIDNIVPNFINGFIYGALVETFCSEQNARMMAMDNANKNATSMIGELTKQYNRQRQAAITQEITEVASGAKALKRAKAAKEAKLRKQSSR